MNPFHSVTVYKVFEILHITTPAWTLRHKKQKYNEESPQRETTTFTLSDISVPEPKIRVGLPTGLTTTTTTNNTSASTNNINYVNYNHLRASHSDPCKELEERILRLWKKVWLGLYQFGDVNGPYHHERIKALYLGAGLTRAYRVGELNVLNKRFIDHGRNHGILELKLHKDQSFLKLQSLVEILEAYEKEIPNLEKLYTILREGQLALDDEDGFGGNDSRIHQTQRKYLSIAEPLEKRLIHYDARMDVLNMDLLDEAMQMHGHSVLKKGLPVYRRVFGTWT